MKKCVTIVAIMTICAVMICACSKKTDAGNAGDAGNTADMAAEQTTIDADSVDGTSVDAAGTGDASGDDSDYASEVTSGDSSDVVSNGTSDDALGDGSGDIFDDNTGDTADASEGSLPAYEYPGPEAFYSVLYQYLIDEFAGHYDECDVTIPCPIIVAMDETNPDDILVWGNFWIYNYNLNDDILENVSGGSYPGLIHLKRSDDAAGYEVTGMDQVGDGSDYDPSSKRIFGEHYDEFVKSGAETEANENLRTQIISDYVAANNLSITAYKDYGWDPVPLKK